MELTKRESQIAGMISQGLSTAKMAAALGVTVNTIEAHRYRLMAKLGCRNAADVTRHMLQTKALSDSLPLCLIRVLNKLTNHEAAQAYRWMKYANPALVVDKLCENLCSEFKS